MAENGTNDMAETVVTTSLPSYVSWEDNVSGTGSIEYDSVRRLITWDAGSVDSNSAVFTSFQVRLSTSKTQIGSTPTLVKEQRLRAKDLFTGIVVRDTNPSITTEMSTETGYPEGNGKVVE